MNPSQIGRYRITAELGKGSMGIVYEGIPQDGDHPVAIKVFYPDRQLSAEQTSNLRDRFEREGAALRQVRHENIVSVLEVGSEEGFEYFVMEKLQGHNLKELFSMGTRFTLSEAFDIMLQLLAGLEACHAAGIVHRDVKPANVIRSSSGAIKLTDFGIARIITDQTLSRVGTIVGTPNYMSPEQIRGEEVDHRTDIFSAGVLMYELLTSKKPFDGPDVTAIMYNVINVHPPSPRFFNGVLPIDIEEAAYKALAKVPADRYSNAAKFAGALRDIEQELHYREDTEAVLQALPAAPDAESLIAPDSSTSSVQTTPPSSAAIAQSLAVQLMADGIKPGKIYCIDCGMENDAAHDFCIRCMRPLVKRDMISQLASQQARLLHKLGRGDWVFLTCLSIVMAGTLILIIYLFIRGVT